MINRKLHNFHIPVMGLAYTIDSPIKLAHFGIDSVISIIDDALMEKMNAFYSEKFDIPYRHITTKINDYRAERITSYLNIVDKIVKKKYTEFCTELSENKHILNDFIAMLPPMSDIKKGLQFYVSSQFNKANEIRNFLSQYFTPGNIDVNIMTKVDKANYNKNEALSTIYNDAHASLRGYANSKLCSSLVLSAGMNPSLYNYIADFDDFFPDANGSIKKKIILKVSDFRSALIQGNFLAKKGIWVSEYRIESGLNCGGHAFATEGLLLGPILQEFKQRKDELKQTTYELLIKALLQKNKVVPKIPMDLKITVQGGVGTADEHDFLLKHYTIDSVGWGSPFLLVPEATSTDTATRKLLAGSDSSAFYRSEISPLGVPFNTVKGATNEYFKTERIINNKPGSSCPKKLLALSKEYDETGICTASHKYQRIKLSELENLKDTITENEYKNKKDTITVKACLCVGLANSAYIENNIKIKGEEQGVVICPGPNMAYFDKEVSLKDMVRHIYGYHSVLAKGYRPNMFIKELQLYIDYLIEDIKKSSSLYSIQQIKKWSVFKNNLLEGTEYYESVFMSVNDTNNVEELKHYKKRIKEIMIPEAEIVTSLQV